VVTDRSQHPTELMDFRGARLAVLEELPEDRRLNMRRIKAITGPEITARYCGADSTPFRTSHALVISTNHDPVITETDHGSWRRLQAMRFPYRYYAPGELPAVPRVSDADGVRDRPGEPGLRERMAAGEDGRSAAVLAWLIDGARRWYAGDPAAGRLPETCGPVPERMAADRQQWQAGSNPMFAFATEELAGDPEAQLPVAELNARFRLRLAAAQHPPWSDKLVADRLAECCESLGWNVTRTTARTGSTTAKVWRGIRFQTAEEQDSPGTAQVSDLESYRGYRSSGDYAIGAYGKTGRLAVTAVTSTPPSPSQPDPGHCTWGLPCAHCGGTRETGHLG
jgi:hypothetical protein